jgi:hypothetical protein
MPLDREYWESLDVSIQDIIDNETKLDDVQERLEHKLEGLFGDCNTLIKDYYNVRGSTLYESIYSLFINNKDDFRELFALATYSENKVNSEFITELANKHLKSGIATKIAGQTGSSLSLLLPLLKTNPDLLYDIHYAHILQCKPVREFRINSKLPTPAPFAKIDNKKIDAFLQEFEDRSKAKVKLPSKVWRYKTDGNTALIVYRREKRLRSRLSKIEKNEYHKTGSQKIILFRDGGNILQVCSKDQKIVKISQFVLNKLTNEQIRYSEVINQFNIKKLKEFIDSTVSHKIDDCLLLSIRVQNVALQSSSPTIELSCDDDAAPALEDLNKNYGLLLLDKIEELQSFRIKLESRSYTIRTIVEDDVVTLLLDNRNIREENKDTLMLFLEKYLS